MDWECHFPGDTDRPKKADADTIQTNEGQEAKAEGGQTSQGSPRVGTETGEQAQPERRAQKQQ